jgi:hypothetical protein
VSPARVVPSTSAAISGATSQVPTPPEVREIGDFLQNLEIGARQNDLPIATVQGRRWGSSWVPVPMDGKEWTANEDKEQMMRIVLKNTKTSVDLGISNLSAIDL